MVAKMDRGPSVVVGVHARVCRRVVDVPRDLVVALEVSRACEVPYLEGAGICLELNVEYGSSHAADRVDGARRGHDAFHVGASDALLRTGLAVHLASGIEENFSDLFGDRAPRKPEADDSFMSSHASSLVVGEKDSPALERL